MVVVSYMSFMLIFFPLLFLSSVSTYYKLLLLCDVPSFSALMNVATLVPGSQPNGYSPMTGQLGVLCPWQRCHSTCYESWHDFKSEILGQEYGIVWRFKKAIILFNVLIIVIQDTFQKEASKH